MAIRVFMSSKEYLVIEYFLQWFSLDIDLINNLYETYLQQNKPPANK